MEYLPVVNDNDEVVGKALRAEVYEKKQNHRIVHVLVFHSDGRMLLQQRSSNVSFMPLHWVTAAGGHVHHGESYAESAIREYQEELGSVSDIKKAHYDIFSDARGLNKFITTFTAMHDGPFAPSEEEVERVEYFTLEEIQKMINNGEKFHLELLYLLEKYYGIVVK